MLPGRAALRRYVVQYMVPPRVRHKTSEISKNAVLPGAQEGTQARRLEGKDRADDSNNSLPAEEETPVDVCPTNWALTLIGDLNGKDEDKNDSSD